MNKKVEEMNIFEKLAAATQSMGAVAKNLNVGFGKNSYKAVSEADVLVPVKKVEADFRIYSYPVNREIVENGTIQNMGSDGKIVPKRYLRVKTTYRFINLDKPEEYIDVIGFGDGVDSQDKAPGKAMTYSDKYCLLKAYKIITGEDPDQYASQPLMQVQAQPSQPHKPVQSPAGLNQGFELLPFQEAYNPQSWQG